MLDKLPSELLERTLSFVGSARDFSACEKSCKTLRGILQPDSMWIYCEENLPSYQDEAQREMPRWPTLYREKALVWSAWQQCLEWQEDGDSPVLSVVDIPLWHLLCK